MFNFEISYKHNPSQGGGRWGGHLPEWRRAGGGRSVDDAERRGGGTPVEEGSRCMSPSGTSGSRAARQQERPVAHEGEGGPAPAGVLRPTRWAGGCSVRVWARAGQQQCVRVLPGACCAV
jgi:hypothetical protein